MLLSLQRLASRLFRDLERYLGLVDAGRSKPGQAGLRGDNQEGRERRSGWMDAPGSAYGRATPSFRPTPAGDPFREPGDSPSAFSPVAISCRASAAFTGSTGRTADRLAAGGADVSGGGHAGFHPLAADHCPLELGNQAEHREHRAPRRRAGLEPLLVQVKVDPLGVQLTEKAQQVGQRAAEPVDRPGGDQVDLAPADGAQQPAPRRALLARRLIPALSNRAATCQPWRSATAWSWPSDARPQRWPPASERSASWSRFHGIDRPTQDASAIPQAAVTIAPDRVELLRLHQPKGDPVTRCRL